MRLAFSRFSALALTAMLLLGALSGLFVPVASAQLGNSDLAVVEDEMAFFRPAAGSSGEPIDLTGRGTQVKVRVNATRTSANDDPPLKVTLVVEALMSGFRLGNEVCTYMEWAKGELKASREIFFNVRPDAVNGTYTFTAHLNTLTKSELSTRCSKSYVDGAPSYSEDNLLGPRDENNVGTRKLNVGLLPDFKVGEIRWCSGLPPESNNNCHAVGNWQDEAGGNALYYNRTYYSTAPTYFDAVILNSGHAFVNPNTNAPSPFHVNFTVRHNGSGQAVLSHNVRWDRLGDATENDRVRSKVFNLLGAAGNYTLTVKVDPFGDTFDSNFTNNTKRRYVEVVGADIAANLTTTNLFGGKGATPQNPLPQTGTFTFWAGMKNVGRVTPPSERGLIRFGVYLDEIDPVNAVCNAAGDRQFTDVPASSLAPGNAIVGMPNGNVRKPFEWHIKTDGSPCAITPGKHTLYISADAPEDGARGNVFEGDELNNTIALVVYIKDDVVPAVSSQAIAYHPQANTARDTEPASTTPPGCGCFAMRPETPFSINATITDNSNVAQAYAVILFPNGTVAANVSLAPVPQTANFTKAFDGKESFWKPAGASKKVYGLYNYYIAARDDSGNWITTKSQLKKFHLKEWTKNTVVTRPAASEGHVFDYDPAGTAIVITIKVNNTRETGHPDRTDFHNPIGKTLWLKAPKENAVSSYEFSSDLSCRGDGVLVERVCTSGHDEYSVALTTSADPKEAIGKYTAWINVSDKIGEIKRIPYNFSVLDQIPELVDKSHPETLDAGQAFKFYLNASDDMGLAEARLNFTLPGTSFVLNKSLTGPTNKPKEGMWYAVFPTGFGTNLSRQAVYKVTVLIRDINNNWKNDVQFDLTLRDNQQPPTLVTGVTPPPPFQIGENATFFAIARDDTEVVVNISLFKNAAPFLNATMTETTPGNWTHTWTCPEAGIFSFRISATDSAGHEKVDVERPFDCVPNTAPRTAWTPGSGEGVSVNGVNYVGPSPTLHFLTSDGADNVNETSIVVKVNGVAAQFDKQYDASRKGYRLTLPPQVLGAPLAHNASVTVEITSADLSSAALSGTTTFSFRIDALPPRTRLLSLQPSIAKDSTTYVGPSTRFILGATDPDGLPTGVAGTFYEVGRVSLSGLTRYPTGGFTLKSIPDVYAGPGQYIVRWNSTDEVGNHETRGIAGTTSASVYLDENPPAENLLDSDHHGRFLNISARDIEPGSSVSGSGVKRVTVFYRLDRGPEVRLEATLEDGKWRAVLPAGKRGENVTYYLELEDEVGNVGHARSPTKPYYYVVGNSVPGLTLRSPANDATVKDVLRILWTTWDDDVDDRVVVTAYYRLAGQVGDRLIGNVSDGTHIDWNTLDVPDGKYEITVVASDGFASTRVVVPITVANAGPAISQPRADREEVRPREPLLVTARINKAEVRSVKALVHRNGELVQTVEMFDNGQNGDARANDRIYSARVTVDSTGSYTVIVEATYVENNEPVTSKSNAGAIKFSVKSTAGDIVAENAVMLVLVGLLAAALGAVALVAWRKWRGAP